MSSSCGGEGEGGVDGGGEERKCVNAYIATKTCNHVQIHSLQKSQVYISWFKNWLHIGFTRIPSSLVYTLKKIFFIIGNMHRDSLKAKLSEFSCLKYQDRFTSTLKKL